jgi:hypothetical protein
MVNTFMERTIGSSISGWTIVMPKVHQSEHIFVMDNYTRPLFEYKIRFGEADPTQFRVGDIVEVQMTLTMVPIKKERFKMISQLRTVALLDGSFTDVSPKYALKLHHQHNQIQHAAMNRMKYINRPTAKIAVKRKIGYGYESEDVDMREARSKMIKMNMNDRA